MSEGLRNESNESRDLILKAKNDNPAANPPSTPSSHASNSCEFIGAYSAISEREKFTYDDLIARDKTSLDLFWLKDDSLADLDNLPEPEVIADEIIENIEAGLASFRSVAASLGK